MNWNDREKKKFLLKVVLKSSLLFILTAWVIFQYNEQGLSHIKYLMLLIWLSGAVGVHFMPEERENLIRETRWAIIGYLFYLILYHFSYNQITEIANTNLNRGMDASVYVTLKGALRSIPILFIEIGLPVGFVVWIGQKFRVHLGGKRKNDKFKELKTQKPTERGR